MKIGLYFGTFNPIHVGHLIIANHMAEYSDLDRIWLVVTPHNPFKKKNTLLDNHHRFDMVYEATKDYDKLEASDIEFKLPQPSYTINTLTYLLEKHPNHEFSLIMGEDNLKGFHKWKNNDIILEHHDIYVYPRISEGKTETQLLNHPKIHQIKAPIMEISSTFIRQAVRDGKSCKPLLPEHVWKYIDDMNFYK
ncbi:nicotinate (nicotinamide) nucleotide adenylyltransferase [Formosa sp. 3Alg 14/1]|uniref:nicotinate (nicotinamide) nucleotide adenylyltransferase n=1 Tax=Formosa sp. 3Alg 14/1 TaxID=3382190 RepID=UPI0039BDF8B5